MKLKTFEQYNPSGKDYKEYINKIIMSFDETEIEDIYKSEETLSFYMIDKCPVSFHFIGNDVQIIVEVDGFTDTLGIYDINNELDQAIDTAKGFDYTAYKEANK